ncbi:MAG: PorP/SprF family type IX secretion system membrane protein [Ruminococcus flavefaciens]|nr:PorP/SprF family type IX secretion system membrane protein [Ruminococcus flavefaciens]
MHFKPAHIHSWALLAVLLCSVPLRAQNNTPIFTQQLFHKVNFNPAAVRPDPVVDVSLFGRMQWVGIKGAPKNIMLNASGYLPEIKSGISGSIMGESFGLTFTMNAKFGYSYHIHLGRKNYLSFGVNAGLIYKNFEGSKIKVEDETDELVNFEDVNDLKPDVDFGLMFTFNKFSLGLSATHLTAWAYDRKHDYFAPQEGYHAFIQFKGDISPKFAIDPYIAAHYVGGYLKADAILNFRILDIFWFGGGYRYNDAVVLMAGAKIGRVFSIGYSYDLGMGGMKKYHSGSHEVFLSLKFETTRKVGEVTDTPLMFE